MPEKAKRGVEATSQNNSTKRKKPTQEDIVLNYLREHDGMTTHDAVTKLYVMNPQERIRKLRDRGYDIDMTYTTSASGARYGIYRLRGEA